MIQVYFVMEQWEYNVEIKVFWFVNEFFKKFCFINYMFYLFDIFGEFVGKGSNMVWVVWKFSERYFLGQ